MLLVAGGNRHTAAGETLWRCRPKRPAARTFACDWELLPPSGVRTHMAMAYFRIGPMTEDSRWRKLLAPSAFALLLLVVPALYAQPPAEPTLPPRTVNLTVEQRHIIKELMKDVKAEDAKGDVPTKVGDKVPDNVAKPMPSEIAQRVPQVKSHTFFVKAGHIVLVNPKDNTI